MVNMKYEYYFNNVPGSGLCRNNLIYTSLISEDKKTFVQWYYNDTEYHAGRNQVVDPLLMEEKWNREIKYLQLMQNQFPNLVPEILEIDHSVKKIYLKIDGVDLWQRQLDCAEYPTDWQEQIIEIHRAHKSLGLYKYSQHPSSYFPVNGKLKSINYFFCYHQSEGPITISDHLSHIYTTRQQEMKKYTESLGISWNTPQPLDLLETLCWDSFQTNYPKEFIDKIKCIK